MSAASGGETPPGDEPPGSEPAGVEHPGWTPAPLDRLGSEVWGVMGGGGLKGLAHVGAWQALEEANVALRGIVGTSIGALIGACVAGGMGWRDLVPLAFALRKEDIVRINRRAILINGIRQESLFQGDPLRDYIDRVLPVKRWEDLEIPLQMNAVDLETGATHWFGTGADTDVTLPEAVYASTALPVFYPPARIGERVFVDGGAEYSLPLHRAVELGASGLVGVDVGQGQHSHPHQLIAQGMLAIHQRVFAIMSWRKRTEMIAQWDGPPLLFVRPRLEGYQTFDFDHVQYFLEEGYRATRSTLLAPGWDGP